MDGVKLCSFPSTSKAPMGFLQAHDVKLVLEEPCLKALVLFTGQPAAIPAKD